MMLWQRSNGRIENANNRFPGPPPSRSYTFSK
jgi:hypothetical protein